MKSFSEALESVPLALAENSGFAPIHTLADIKSRQIKENNPRLGIDCLNKGTNGNDLILFCFVLSCFCRFIKPFHVVHSFMTFYRYEDTVCD